MRVLKLVTLIITLLCAGNFRASSLEIVHSPERSDLYGLFAPRFEFSFIEGDPDDPAAVDVNMIVFSPSGKKYTIPGFCVENDKVRDVSLWESRFAPREEGEYSFRFSVSLPSRELYLKTEEKDFFVEDTGRDGFLRVSPDNGSYLVFDSSLPFFGIGHNVPWVHNSDPEIFGRYFSLLSNSGGNITRIWMCDWSLGLETEGIGNYDRSSSEKLDRIVELAEEYGIYIMLCLNTYGNLMEDSGMWGEGRWDKNPYNAVNGGPCHEPEDFFTHPEAIRTYKNKIRYIAARWSYSPNIFAYELWNEYNSPPDWTRKMASYIKSVDHTGKMVTTSLGFPDDIVYDENEIWNIEEIDLVTIHYFGDGQSPELITPVVEKSRGKMKRYSKPVVVSEFGINFSRDDRHYDPRGKGTALHNSIWASAMSGSFASAMNWWHDTYVRPRDLYCHYLALSRFLEGVDWTAREIFFPEISLVMNNAAYYRTAEPRDVIILPLDRWGKAPASRFKVMANGDITGGGVPYKYLHGSEKKEFRTDHVYKVNYHKPGRFTIHVGTVSQGGDLRVYINGEKALQRKFPAGKGKGPWKRSNFLAKYGVYQCVYDEKVSFDIPAGEHEIRLSNEGKDWIGIEKIVLEGYKDTHVANARCIALGVGKKKLFWIQNRESNWYTFFRRRIPRVISGAYFEVYDLPEDVYKLEFWDTRKGEKISSRSVRSRNGRIRIDLPDLERDIACKLIPEGPGRD